MKFYTTYYWQKEAAATSLVLQQACCKNDGRHVVLACVCTEDSWLKGSGEAAIFGRNLADWFHERGLKRYGRTGDLNFLPDELSRIAGRNETLFSCAGIFCAGREFLLFYRGRQSIYLLNRGLFGTHIECLTEETSEMQTKGGMVEGNIGLLAATEPFYQNLTREMIAECLEAGSILHEKQASKRLEELGDFGRMRGGREMGAVFMVSKEEA